nr:collagen alpha-1(XII) chain-like [Salvelinus alpinus]
MKIRLSLAAAAFLAVLLSSVEAQVEPPSDLRFKILNENTVQMTWNVPLTRIEGFKIQVASETDEPTKHVSLPATATKTSITDLTPDMDYVVTIIAYSGSEESLPISGQLTIQSSGTAHGGPRKPQVIDSVKCSFSAVTDLVFLVDGSWSAGRDFKYIRNFISAMAGAFEIGEDKTRVGLVQYSTDTKTEFNLNQHVKWGELLRAINTLPYKGGNTMTGEAMDYLLKNTFTEANGARKGFPKVAMIITDGKSQDPVEAIAKKLKNMGVEIFTLGIKGADEDELKQMASTPYRTHVYNVLNFDLIKNVQKELITHVCSGVDDQLNSLVSGEEVIEPASNLRVMEMASKSMRVTWDISFGDVSGYKLQLIPMMAGSKRQELYVGASQTSVMVTGLSPDTEYQISLFALKGLTPSEPIMTMEKTEPVKVSLECSLGVDVQADVVILVDGSYSIGLSNFAKVRAFLEVLVNSFDIGQDKIQISLVQYSRDAHTEFYLNTHHEMSAVVHAVRTFPYRGGSTNTGRAMTYVREKIFLTNRGSRPNVPRVTILITDGKSSDSFKDPATKLKKADVEIFAVGVKDAVRSELEAIATEPVETHVYTVEDFDAFQRISKELTQSICLRIEQELLNIKKKSLLPPRSLTFSEVAARSFRATWETDALNVLSYLIQFRPAADVDGDFVSMSLPGDTLTTLLPHLTPLTHYEVNVFAQYTEGDSFPLNGFETTLDEHGPVRNLRVSEETTDSFRVSWAAAPGAVVRYRLTYVPVRGDSTRLETATVGDETTIVLPELFPLTTYRVMVAAEYQSGTGAEMKIDGTTKEALGSPRDLQVFDETVSTMKLSWAAAPGRVLQYRINFRPSAGGERKEVWVKGGNTNTLLKNLQPGTEYDLVVSARYSSGLGDPLEGKGTTLEELGSPKDLVTSDVTDTSFAASWTAAPGNVKMYRIRWKSLYSDESGEKTVPGDVTNTVLDGLTPETLYQVSVVASYGRGDGDPLTGQETTDVSAAAKALTVSDETERSMKITWMAAPGKVINYRVTYVPTDGGKEMFAKVPGTSTSTVLKRLTPVTTYDITVHPIYKRGEGKARQGVGTTLSPYKAPRNLKTSDPGKTSFRVSWDAAPGDVRGYKVTFHPSGNDIDLGELLVGPYDNTVVLEELRAGTKYSVAVFGMFDGGHSAALAGEEKTTLSDAPDVPLEPWNEAKCKSQAKADIILLVDGSWSIGRLNFKTIRAFIARIVGVFDIGPDRVMIGMVQYSGDPKTEWHLNAHSTRDGLLKAVADLPYKGGNTMTGMALNYILTNNFKSNVGLRKDSRKIGVLITDGKSQDEIITNSQVLRDENIELYAIGVKNADENELRSIASDPDEIHMYNVNDFSFLLDIVDELTINLCNSVKGPGGLDPPTNLVTSEVTHHSFRATWTGPEGPVEKFRIDYMPVVGGITEQMIVDGTVTTVVLTKLTPLTEYAINVFSVTGGETSEEPLKGTETTLPLPGVIKLTVYDETMTTFKVKWEKAEGATGYMLLYRAINATVPTVEKEVRVGADVNDVQLKELITDTAYTLTLFALHGVAASNPLIDQGVTLPLPPSGNLRITGVTHSTMKLRWDASPGKVLKYIITYKPDEGELKEVEVNGDITFLPLTNLISQSEYDVAVTPVYDEGVGNSMLGQAITDVVPAPQNLKLSEVTQTSFRATWEHGAPDVALYRIGWTKKGENNFQYSILNSDETSHNLENLDPDTLYDVTVTAIYPDESESEDLIGSQRTLLKMTTPAPTGPPQNLQVFNATTVTLTVKWDHAPGPVQNYKISFQTVAGGKALSTQVGGKKNSVVLQKLTPDTPYSVTVAAIYPSGEAKDISGRGKTKPLGFVKNLQVIEPTTSTLNVRWDAAEGNVREYIVVYIPTAGGEQEVDQVSGTTTTTVLKELNPDTEYTVTVVPVYHEMEGLSRSQNGKTNPLGGVKNMKVIDPTINSLSVRWDPAVGNVRNYKVFYVAQPDGKEQMEQVSGGTTNLVLHNLESDTQYNVSVVPVYPDVDGIMQSEMGKTKPLGGVKNLQVTDPTTNSLRVRWEPAEGDVRQYTVIYAPLAGGPELTTTVSGMSTNTVLRNLVPDTEYKVTLVPMYGDIEGKRTSENGKTKALGGVKNLQVTDPTTSSLKVRWEPAEGNVRQYRLFYVPASGGVEDMEQVSGGTTSTVLRNLLSDTPYTITVVPVYPEGEGLRQSETGKTLPRTPPKNVQVYNPTTNSLNVRWEPASGQVQQYRVIYTPLSGERPAETVLVPGNINNAFLDSLIPDTPYSVSVLALYADGEGPPVKGDGKTLPRARPRNLRVFDATTNTLTIGWDHAEGPVQQYKIAYAPTTGDPITEFTVVPGNRNNAILQNLLPDTPYNITVEAIYADGAGGSLNGPGRTVGLLEPRNLRVSDEWYTRFRVAWDPSPSPVLGYKLVYTPAGEMTSDSGPRACNHEQGPITRSEIKVTALHNVTFCHTGFYSSKVPVQSQSFTAMTNVAVIKTYNVGFDKFCIKWSPHRAATSYRIKLNPLDPSSKGQQEITITAAQSQYCFKGLSPDALYSATVFVQTPNLEGPGVSTKERTLVKPTEAPTLPPTPPPPPTIPPAWAVCKGAKADVVFLIDGSWSIGEDSFRKVVQFVFSMIGAFDVIGSTGMQVSFVQYSDEAKTEFRLNSYSDKGNALAALQLIQYRGGNTKTGAALMHVKEKVFAPENGMRRNVPKVVVAVTDGRSQDEVKKNAATLQHAGYSVFVVGVADVDFAELQNIGSKPSDRHIFVVDDFDAFATIQDNLVTFICETATSSCPLIYLNGFTSPGFRMLEAFNLTEKTYGYIKGVSMEPGSFNSYTAYRLHKNSFLTQPTTEIHPDGLPHSYTIIMMFRLLPDTPNEAFDIWQVSTKDDKPEVGVTIDPSSQTISYYNKDTRGEIQRVTFDNDQVKRIFHGSFHKLHLLVSPTKVKLNLDCQEVAEKEIKEAGNTSTDGYQVLGKMSKSIGSKGESATFQLQMFDIVCTLGWTSRDRCCDLPSMREESKCPSLPNACTCTSESTGPQGTQGAVGAPGSKGPRGERGETGPAGPIGPRGDTGLPGPMGLPGPQGSSGLSIPGEAGRQGPKGEAGDSGLPGQKGPPGKAGTIGPIGPAGPRGPQGKEGQAGSRGPTGPMGPPGSPGMPGASGKPGKPGDTGVSGANGIKGDRGERGDFAPQNMMRSIARQVCEQIVNGQMSRVNSMLNQIPSGYRSSNNPGPPGAPGPSGNQGPRGEPGQTGRNGFPGSSGQPGQQGERGPAGEKGDRGTAAVGQRGQRGPPGPTGEARTGPPGPAGSSGPRGPPGRQGFAGIRGQPGTPGYCDSSQCVSIPYNGQGYRDPYPPEPETYVVPIPEEEDDSQNERRKRSLSRMESKSIGS